jgi:hypothetical protein
MTAIICTAMICGTVLLCINKLAKVYTTQRVTQQPSITQEDLDKAYKEAETEKIPDFQEVINVINKEFTGIMEDDYE